MIRPSSAAMRRYSPFSMTLACVQVSPERYQRTGQGSLMAFGGAKTAKVISHLQASDSCAYTPCMPPKAVAWEMMFIFDLPFLGLPPWRDGKAGRRFRGTANGPSG